MYFKNVSYEISREMDTVEVEPSICNLARVKLTVTMNLIK